MGRETDAPATVTSIYGSTIFYREISRPGEVTLTTKDYLFRYNPEWFWALSDERAMQLFRKYAHTSPQALGVLLQVRGVAKAVIDTLHLSGGVSDRVERLIKSGRCRGNMPETCSTSCSRPSTSATSR